MDFEINNPSVVSNLDNGDDNISVCSNDTISYKLHDSETPTNSNTWLPDLGLTVKAKLLIKKGDHIPDF